MQNYYTSLSHLVNAFESKLNLEELEADQLTYNAIRYCRDTGSNGQESEEANIKKHGPTSQTDQISNLDKTDLSLHDQQTTNKYFRT